MDAGGDIPAVIIGNNRFLPATCRVLKQIQVVSAAFCFDLTHSDECVPRSPFIKGGNTEHGHIPVFWNTLEHRRTPDPDQAPLVLSR
jgi:hypothetical protein